MPRRWIANIYNRGMKYNFIWFVLLHIILKMSYKIELLDTV